ncbi:MULTISPECIES: sigma-54-dependent transcriptional regulator [Hydrogenophaga]|jgi:two-component system response regulator PilR (NtrC family)|uniref:Fis family two component sigma-54 specific transcriptional regulator n=1 Tax=Hydrogenophaga intermedia TaxID=65786 RepID=A0A1L1P8J5_HYDIT|nr:MULTISPECIES: sigma-54 dependent transcriptional regulator [Hydrogenophaga]AOS77986.1 sigma-54-dependent Fis family transcriptional regulator [Hydrogenophaga sp. PBC]TMU74814.1 sigma-54-dependent Fis family transcriptional regulator [Hydrogenophaga intermedia]CDN86102.1 Fis family two component sigma-54 specific transcriptional regulator [Hydrogenophaga intermedia]
MSTSASASILVVDDEPDLRTLYELTLLREGHAVTTAANLEQAREGLAQQRFDVLITDMQLPDGLGLTLLREVADGQRTEKCIVITAFGSAENAVESLKAGAFDYLTKPVDLRQLRGAVTSALRGQRAPLAAVPANEPTRSAPPPPSGVRALARLVGQAPSIVQIKARIEKVATSMAPVLILGESGTGKELVARAVHECSHRASGPFIAVNCGAIPENLIEAEFFGARKGAYTGASADREGYFQAAHGGTLFLDEIGDLPLAMQAKLLRVIQERRVRSLGAVQEDAVDVRLVSATHRDLPALVQAGQFRQDLYYRLNVIGLRTPALRDRPEDLPLLAQALLERLCAEAGQAVPELSSAALAWLQARELPGNVRELENLLQRALALANGPVLHAADFGETGDTEPATLPDPLPDPLAASEPYRFVPLSPPEADSGESLPSDLQRYLDDQERQVLLKALQECGFNRTAAAARLGLNLRQIRYRIQRLGIVVPGAPGHGDSDAAD